MKTHCLQREKEIGYRRKLSTIEAGGLGAGQEANKHWVLKHCVTESQSHKNLYLCSSVIKLKIFLIKMLKRKIRVTLKNVKERNKNRCLANLFRNVSVMLECAFVLRMITTQYGIYYVWKIKLILYFRRIYTFDINGWECQQRVKTRDKDNVKKMLTLGLER